MSHQIPDEPPPTLHSPSPLEVAVGDTAYTVRRGKKWWKLAHPDQIINLCYCTKPPEYTLAAGLTGTQAREVALRAEELAAQETRHEIQGLGVVVEMWKGKFRYIPAVYVEREHKARSRKYDGLLEAMRRAYGQDFSEEELVTVLGYRRVR